MLQMSLLGKGFAARMDFAPYKVLKNPTAEPTAT